MILGLRKRWRCHWSVELGLSFSGRTSPGDSHTQDLYWVMRVWNLVLTEFQSCKCIPNFNVLAIIFCKVDIDPPLPHTHLRNDTHKTGNFERAQLLCHLFRIRTAARTMERTILSFRVICPLFSSIARQLFYKREHRRKSLSCPNEQKAGVVRGQRWREESSPRWLSKHASLSACWIPHRSGTPNWALPWEACL